MSVQIGNSSNTTHLSDDTGATVIFDSTKTLTGGGTASARFLTLGQKIGSGDEATGIKGGMVCLGAVTALTGTVKLYGATLRQTAGALTWSPPADNTGEAINCLFQSTATGTAPFNFASQTTRIANLYNCDFSHTTAVQIVSNLNVAVAKKITIGASSPSTFVSSGAASQTLQDVLVFGTPTQSDFRWATASAVSWALVRPKFSSNADKFSVVSPGNPSLSAATVEFWGWGVKIVDSDGVGVGGIPVRLTDSPGNVQVDTTTDSNGRVSFTTALNAVYSADNVIAVMDHYAVGTTYTQRHRGPFLLEVNTGGSANPGYPSRRYYFEWPGAPTVTTTSGTFEDMNDVVSLQDPSGASTNWTECVLA